MKLFEFFNDTEVNLDLAATTKKAVLEEMVELFGLDQDAQQLLVKLLKKRENLGSTGIGKHVAIPHCRSLVVNRLRVAYGRKPAGLDFNAIDDLPVNHLFLIVAPPVEISNQYLPVLGKIAQFCKNEQNIAQLNEISSTDEFLAVLEDAEV
jgi:mannitol/fructose-specific phosphotransferase system IIA component (Ntr-type)